MISETEYEATAFENRVLDALNQTSGVTNPERWLVEALGGGRSQSGANVNVTTTLGLPPMWGGVSMIAGHMAEMELFLKRKTTTGGSEVAERHGSYRLLNRDANDWTTSYKLRETLQMHALLQGNGRAWIRRNELGQPVELVQLMPWSTYTVVINNAKFHATYFDPTEYAPEPLQVGGHFVFPDEDVLHIYGPSYNGYWGLHLIQILKDAIGLGISGQDMTGSGFKNNGRPGMLIEAPMGRFADAQSKQQWIGEFNRAHQGPENAGRVGLLDAGMKAHQMQMSSQDSQLRDLRQFTREDVFYALRIPTEPSGTYKGITELLTKYKQVCLGPWGRTWECECRKKLLSGREKAADSHYWEFDWMHLLKGDPNTFADYTSKLRQQTSINGNEVRQMHGLNPVADPVLEDYGNPNTSSDEPSPQEMPEEPNARAAVIRNFRTLINHEQERLVRAAKSKPNFLSWCDEFYDKFEPRLVDVCRELNIAEEFAEQHCKTSRELILELTGTVTDKQLPAEVAGLVDRWDKRAEKFYVRS